MIARPAHGKNGSPADTETDPDAPPVRAAAIQRHLDTWIHAMRLAPDDARRLQAITTATKLLAPFGDAAIEPRDYMTAIAYDMYNLDADQVQVAIANGVRQAPTNGAGPNASSSPGASASAPWTAPKEIKPALLPVPAFDPELLPPALRDFVMDEAERVPCP